MIEEFWVTAQLASHGLTLASSDALSSSSDLPCPAQVESPRLITVLICVAVSLQCQGLDQEAASCGPRAQADSSRVHEAHLDHGRAGVLRPTDRGAQQDAGRHRGLHAEALLSSVFPAKVGCRVCHGRSVAAADGYHNQASFHPQFCLLSVGYCCKVH
jgi:hypothetical protein